MFLPSNSKPCLQLKLYSCIARANAKRIAPDLTKNSDLTKKEWNTGSVLETLFVSLVSYVTSTRAGSFPALGTFFQWPKTWSFHQTLRLRPAWPLTPPPKLLAIISNLKGWMVFIRCAKEPMTTTHEKTPGRLKALGSCLVFLWQSCQGLASLQNSRQMWTQVQHSTSPAVQQPWATKWGSCWSTELPQHLVFLGVRQKQKTRIFVIPHFVTWSITVEPKKRPRYVFAVHDELAISLHNAHNGTSAFTALHLPKETCFFLRNPTSCLSPSNSLPVPSAHEFIPHQELICLETCCFYLKTLRRKTTFAAQRNMKKRPVKGVITLMNCMDHWASLTALAHLQCSCTNFHQVNVHHLSSSWV